MPAKQVNIHQAKTTLSKLIRRVQKGEEIVIANAGRPVAKLIPVDRPNPRPAPGLGEGTLRVTGEITDPLPDDELDLFYYGEVFPPERK